ncbi:MAG: response regulator, partial [Anaerolineales bacterium]|nr:response regulator [Anaerolineales bacterium]
MNRHVGHMLVIDDDEVNRDLVSRYLRHDGHQVTTAASGPMALQLLEQQMFDVILLDIIMPEMDGYTVLAQLKADYRLREIPVVVISATADMQSFARCIELGAEDYLPIPFNPTILRARVTSCLSKKRVQDQVQAHVAELSLIQELDRRLNASLDGQRVLQILLDWTLRRSGDQAGMTGVVEQDGVRILSTFGYGTELEKFPGAILPLDWEPIAAAVISRQEQHIPDLRGQGILTDSRSMLVAPINREDRAIGLIILENSQPKAWDDDVRQFIARLCDHAAIALNNAQLYSSLEMANTAKSEFIGFVAHELKTPMTAIQGYTSLLMTQRAGALNERQVGFLETMQLNLKRMTGLISDLSDISRIESGRLTLDFEGIQMAELIDESVRTLRGQFESKRQKLTVKAPPDLPLIWGDHLRLSQVLTNLLSNANKYTPEEGQIVVSAEKLLMPVAGDSEQEMVHVAVKDSGMGIDEKEQPRIFNRFFRASDDEARRQPGTGLGLHITRSLVEVHNGLIWFESIFRQGSTFHFVIPVAVPENLPLLKPGG